MNKTTLIVTGILLSFLSFGQTKDSLSINFKASFDQFPLELNKQYITSIKDTVSITTFKCYISDIEVQYADKTVFKEKNSHHLLDVENPNSLQIPITEANDKLISKVVFNIGIDSITNTSGALAGDLDPTKGMYWAWQSGYINMKLEGTSQSCKTRKNQFQFHLGGYLQPYYAMRKKVINVNGNSNINIGIDISIFLAEIHLAQTHSIMIPGKKAMDLADISTKMFYLE
ncbi:MbnP family protein [Flavobacterium buctense]|uniref:MbnP family protein n=1 Tax=Flavobacterium buctense TaxID=1648146 RepID=A0ABU9DZW3_9FLAO|nr:MbnP family protein [Flavobacterium buctense]